MAGYRFLLGVDGTVHALLPPRLSLVLVYSPFHFYCFSLSLYANFPCSCFDCLQPFDVTSSQWVTIHNARSIYIRRRRVPLSEVYSLISENFHLAFTSEIEQSCVEVSASVWYS